MSYWRVRSPRIVSYIGEPWWAFDLIKDYWAKRALPSHEGNEYDQNDGN